MMNASSEICKGAEVLAIVSGIISFDDDEAT